MKQETISIGELATQSGLTVRSLRHYEKMGLIRPARTEARQRIYSFRDIVRLQQIQLLKRAGFTLSRIGEMLGAGEMDAALLLDAQRDYLRAELVNLKESLSAIEGALARVREGERVDLSTLCHIIKIGEQPMDEEKWQKVWDTFYTKEEQENWKAAKAAIPEDERKSYENRWPRLIARAEALVGTDPAAPEAQALLEEWQELNQPFLQANPGVAESARNMYDNMAKWPKDGPKPPFGPEVWAFVKAASEASKKAKG